MINTGNVWVEIDLDQIEKNLREIKKKASPAKVNCVIKANAYGHGSVTLAHALESETDYFSVANLNELIELRQAGIKKPILVLGYVDPSQFYEIPAYNAEICVQIEEHAKLLSEEMVRQNAVCPVHIKLDTGMSRLGFQMTEENIEAVKRISQLPGLRIAGVFTHFACADVEDMSFTDGQYKKYVEFVDRLEREGVAVGIRHVSNSAGILDGNYKEQMVRAGIILYGVDPNGEVESDVDADTAMRFCAKVASIRTIRPGQGVSYGQTWVADRETKIATITVGYADGYFRTFSNRSQVIVNGIPAPIRGRVCMDQSMIDITGRDDVKVGDTVVLYDKAYPETTLYHMAELADTIAYELFCAVNRRVVRVYTRGGEAIESVNYLLAQP